MAENQKTTDYQTLSSLPTISFAHLDKWISNNIVRFQKSYGVNRCEFDSSWLKYTFEHQTGISVTLEQFESAMILSGFSPMQIEGKTQYDIVFLKDIITKIKPKNPFLEFAKKQKITIEYDLNQDSFSINFINSIRIYTAKDFYKEFSADENFPTIASHRLIENYFAFNPDMPSKIRYEMFKKLWQLYMDSGEAEENEKLNFNETLYFVDKRHV